MKTFTARLVNEDEVHMQVDENGNFQGMNVIGCWNFLQLAQTYKTYKGQSVQSLSLPAGSSYYELLMKEVILRAQGKWNYPYKEKELCHCRMVDTEVVDQNILRGAHTPEQVSRLTTASTACGTCRPTVEDIISYRVGPR